MLHLLVAVVFMSLEPLIRLRDNLTSVVKGKPEAIEATIIAVLAGGSILMEDAPGTGKTTLARALAQSLALSIQRIQAVLVSTGADLLPGAAGR